MSLTVIPAAKPAGSQENPYLRGSSAAPTSTDTASGAGVTGQDLLRRAIGLLESRKWISARIRQEVQLFGKRSAGAGVYVEHRSANGPLFRLEMRIQLGSGPSSFLQVCDGRHLWTYEKIRDEEQLKRVDLERLDQALEELGKMPYSDGIAWPQSLGGLRRLLAGLDGAFNFHRVEQTQLHHVRCWRLIGEWKPEVLVAQQAGTTEAGKLVDLRGLPPHLPHYVVVFLGQGDGFPYRIEYRRQNWPQANSAAEREDTTMVSILFHELNLNVPVAPDSFVYNPGDLEAVDDTKACIQRLTLASPDYPSAAGR
jgi:hypothetical protein